MKFSATTLALIAATTTFLLPCFVVQAQEILIVTSINESCVVSGMETSPCVSISDSLAIACDKQGNNCESCNIENENDAMFNKLTDWCIARGGQLEEGPVSGLPKCPY